MYEDIPRQSAGFDDTFQGKMQALKFAALVLLLLAESLCS
jgi:hypothetical protein